MFDVPIHKLIVHFPIALTIIAVIYDSWGLYAKKRELHHVAYGLTLWAAAGALAAVGTGLQLAEMVHLDKGAVTGHAGFGIASDAGRTMVQPKTAEPADFDARPFRQAGGHGIEDHLHRELGVFCN